MISKCILFFIAAIISSLLYELKASTDSDLVDLNEDNWQTMLQGEWMVKLYVKRIVRKLKTKSFLFLILH